MLTPMQRRLVDSFTAKRPSDALIAYLEAKMTAYGNAGEHLPLNQIPVWMQFAELDGIELQRAERKEVRPPLEEPVATQVATDSPKAKKKEPLAV